MILGTRWRTRQKFLVIRKNKTEIFLYLTYICNLNLKQGEDSMTLVTFHGFNRHHTVNKLMRYDESQRLNPEKVTTVMDSSPFSKFK